MKKEVIDFLRRNNCFYLEIACLIVFNAFTALVLWGPLFAHTALVRDTLKHFSFFRDNLHSLNHFSEVAWWNPNVQMGFPLYYASLLGFNCGTPLFVLMGFVAWALGLLHVHVSSFYAWYVGYHGFLIPLFCSFGLLMLARQIFKDFAVVFFITLAASLSPLTVENISCNVGPEQTGYGVLFAAAFLNFLKKPGKTSFLGLTLTAMMLAAALDWQFLFWNVLFVPLFVGTVLLIHRIPLLAHIKQMIHGVPRWHWVMFVALFGVSLLPSFFTFGQGADIIRASVGMRFHSFGYLLPGYPLEILAAGTPAIGVHCVEGPTAGIFPFGRVLHVTYGYMGLLALPLLAIGLIAGKTAWHRRLFILIIAACVIIPLATFSPFFAVLLALPTPLRGVNHYGEAVFRNGTYFLLILGAGLGVQTILRFGKVWRWALIGAFALSSLFAIALFVALYRWESLSNPIFGFSLVMVLLYLTVLIWMARSKRRQAVLKVFPYLFFLVFLDLSTVAFWNLRTELLPASDKVREPSIASIGLGNAPTSVVANTLLEVRPLRVLKDAGVNLSSLPIFGLYGAITPANSIPGKCAIARQTYNTLVLKVDSTQNAFLFWRDVYSPYWSATVDGEKINITQPLGVFKAVHVPQGRSEVAFRFLPPRVPTALVISYLAMTIVAMLWAKSSLREEI